MRARLAAAILGATLAASAVSAQDARTSSSLERPFPANGRVTMDLVAGDYHITGGPQNRVRLDWSVRDAEALARVEARADVRDADLRITTNGPSNRNLKFTIQLPVRPTSTSGSRPVISRSRASAATRTTSCAPAICASTSAAPRTTTRSTPGCGPAT